MEIKFRQALFDYDGKFTGFHCWGFLKQDYSRGKGFINPRCPVSLQDSEKNSEQFTGVKDKNGKDIYVGDIVLCPFDWQRRENDYALVRFGGPDQNAGFYLIGKRAPQNDGNAVTWDLLNPNYGKYIKIVGNIHQTPGLLKSKD